MVRGLPSINYPDQLYEGCLLGKQFRTSFPKESNSRAKKPLELIHADVYGPIKPSLLGKNNYFLLFIDDFLKKNMGLFLKTKIRSLFHLQEVQSCSRERKWSRDQSHEN